MRDGFDPSSLQSCAIAALTSSDLDLKVAITLHAANRWFSRSMAVGVSLGRKAPDRPGRPARPELLPPNLMKKRSIRSQRGRIALVHAIAHIELNAMDLAWDIIARFCHQKLPRSFYDGWVRVALEEAKHFSLLRARLAELDAAYGDFPAHDGLWEAAQNTGHDLVARLAVVPLILEARGLDITPSLIDQLNEIGDTETSYIFSIIYRDELGHVAVGAKWFRYFCFKNQQDPERAFQMLVRRYFRGALKPPFNDFTRCRAGITPMFYRALSAKGN
ncbi:MAG: ferritin-like domain-containing protein [Pseudomonadota bacterium]